MKVIITGASGILGSAVHTAFCERNSENTGYTFDLLPLTYSQTRLGLTRLDLLDKVAVTKLFTEFRPDWVIHCAAERRPDVVERDAENARKLNAGVPAHLAELSKMLKFTLVYISTDYVFDGTSPPYTPSSRTNPLQLYGQSKRDGEVAVLSEVDARVIILRVPVLYGKAPKNSDTAINILLDCVQDQSGKIYKMDHYATRYPTNVMDIGNFLSRLCVFDKAIPPILHYSAAEPFTKYEICLIFARILGLPHTHIHPDAEAPSDANATTRPRDCQLYTGETESMGVEGGLGLSLFEEWWSDYLSVA